MSVNVVADVGECVGECIVNVFVRVSTRTREGREIGCLYVEVAVGKCVLVHFYEIEKTSKSCPEDISETLRAYVDAANDHIHISTGGGFHDIGRQ